MRRSIAIVLAALAGLLGDSIRQGQNDRDRNQGRDAHDADHYL